MRTKRISRQLKKVFGAEDVERSFSTIGADAGPSIPHALVTNLKEMVNKLPEFLNTVEETYQQLEERATMAQRSMELSAAELTDANSSLYQLNQTFDAMVNSLGQGFLLFNRQGQCLEVFSKACLELLETNPGGKPIAEVLHVAANKREGFDGWIEILFQDTLDFTEFSKLGPRSFAHSKGKKVNIEYMPVRNKDGQIDLVIAIATDVTREFEANERAVAMTAQATFVTSILKNRDRFCQFLQQFQLLTEDCAKLLAKPSGRYEDVVTLRGHLHSLKGASASFGMLELQSLIHATETELSGKEDLASSFTFLRKALAEIRSQLERTLRDNSDVIEAVSMPQEPHREVRLSTLMEIDHLLSQDNFDRKALRRKLVEDILSVPCATVFTKFDAVVQETAARCGKQMARIAISGDGAKIVPEPYARLFLTLDHIFRNIVDHGIENPEERVAKGKPREGKIDITIRCLGTNQLEFQIADDGRGVDVEKVRNKLFLMGKRELAESGNREEILDSIFLPGLSTAQTVTEVSGRGLGLEAVRTCLADFGGKISVQSDVGRGTCFRVTLPSLSQMPTGQPLELAVRLG